MCVFSLGAIPIAWDAMHITLPLPTVCLCVMCEMPTMREDEFSWVGMLGDLVNIWVI